MPRKQAGCPIPRNPEGLCLDGHVAHFGHKRLCPHTISLFPSRDRVSLIPKVDSASAARLWFDRWSLEPKSPFGHRRQLCLLGASGAPRYSRALYSRSVSRCWPLDCGGGWRLHATAAGGCGNAARPQSYILPLTVIRLPKSRGYITLLQRNTRRQSIETLASGGTSMIVMRGGAPVERLSEGNLVQGC
ncbi:protein of unknown function [Hyphomicrobium sp. 1Nfss2.1]